MENVPTPATVKTNVESIRQKEAEDIRQKLNKLAASDLRGLQKPTTQPKRPQDRKPKKPREDRGLTSRPFAEHPEMIALQEKANKLIADMGEKVHPHPNTKPRRTRRPRGKA